MHYDVTTLTNEEIQSLQVDSALRILGMIDNALTELNGELFEKTNKFYEAKRDLDNLKNTKNVLVERARILKAIVSNG